MTLEKDIEDVVVTWAKKHGFLTPKVKFVEAGWPDRLFISPRGATIFIEFKRPGERPDKLQEYRIEQLTLRGVPATWTDNTVEGINILKAALEPARLPGTGDKTPAEPGCGGLVSGPWAGENLDLFGSPKDSALKESIFKGVDCSSSPTGVLSVAGGDTEVGGVRGYDVLHTPRDPEGDGPNYGLTDSLD